MTAEQLNLDQASIDALNEFRARIRARSKYGGLYHDLSVANAAMDLRNALTVWAERTNP